MSTTVTPALPGSAMLKKLVRQHTRIKDEPLLLAVQYVPRRDKGDMFLFEIVEGFGRNSVDPEGIVFEVTFNMARPGARMTPGENLHLLMTNPTEFEAAVRQNWKGVRELRQAVSEGNFDVLLRTRKGMALWRSLNGRAAGRSVGKTSPIRLGRRRATSAARG